MNNDSKTARSMEEADIGVQTLPHHEGLPLPGYATPLSSGMDLHAAVKEEIWLSPGSRALVPTGLRLALPPGLEAQVRPRSGLAVEQGVTILNSPGTIDADYRGEVKVVLINLGERPFRLRRGDRVAQLVIQRVCKGRWNPAEDLDETDRSEGGFGHTGR
jgi:dUTP pyrophosphatase